MGWNPLSDFSEEWRGAATGYGRVSVAAYYAFCGLAVMLNLAALAAPPRLIQYACPLFRNGAGAGAAKEEQGNPSMSTSMSVNFAEAYVGLLVNLWQVTIVFLFGALLLLGGNSNGGCSGGGNARSSSLLRRMGVAVVYWGAVYLVHMRAFRATASPTAGEVDTYRGDDGLDCVRQFWPAFAGAHNAMVLVMVAAKLADEWTVRRSRGRKSGGGGVAAANAKRA